jgi:hypothetical protein
MTLLSTRISPPRPNAAWPALWGPTRTAQAAKQGWKLIWDFFGRYLAA